MQIFDEHVSVHYGFIQVFSAAAPGATLPSVDEEFDGDHSTAIKDQTNGLAGARLPHMVSLVTGLHTGEVPLTITWDPQEPALDAQWTDAVEVSVELPSKELSIQTFEDWYAAATPQAGWHRARYSAAEMDAGNELDTPDEDEAAPDRYLLQLWPCDPTADAVVREGSKIAAYWHGVARGEGN
ncbi:hypothetical protein [Nocardioides sp.]|uniref:hypothetical protein n=1 Tax=Nocardioides sp. TaxID=35761 RepID=UPI002B94B42D|nr:hypothetical protein [Nocardioides sp.]HXH77864.1 hypothetical protein [Nocardioides sp.]